MDHHRDLVVGRTRRNEERPALGRVVPPGNGRTVHRVVVHVHVRPTGGRQGDREGRVDRTRIAFGDHHVVDRDLRQGGREVRGAVGPVVAHHVGGVAAVVVLLPRDQARDVGRKRRRRDHGAEAGCVRPGRSRIPAVGQPPVDRRVAAASRGDVAVQRGRGLRHQRRGSVADQQRTQRCEVGAGRGPHVRDVVGDEERVVVGRLRDQPRDQRAHVVRHEIRIAADELVRIPRSRVGPAVGRAVVRVDVEHPARGLKHRIERRRRGRQARGRPVVDGEDAAGRVRGVGCRQSVLVRQVTADRIVLFARHNIVICDDFGNVRVYVPAAVVPAHVRNVVRSSMR